MNHLRLGALILAAGVPAASVEVAPWDGPQKDQQGNIVGFTRLSEPMSPQAAMASRATTRRSSGCVLSKTDSRARSTHST